MEDSCKMPCVVLNIEFVVVVVVLYTKVAFLTGIKRC